jgi:hypothetical protein
MADAPDAHTSLLLDRYRVEGKLGEGGIGTVVKAFDTRLKSMRAIKTLKRTMAADPETFGGLEERFTREAEAGSRMGINPNLVAVYDLVADTAGTLYLILEYVPGGTLADRLRQGPLPLADALRVTADAARGLHAAHAVGIVHRDIKPANIFLAADGRAQVGDFGIAQIDDLSARTRTTVGHPGTPLYMSPEQARMTAYLAPTTDQYSLGLVLFALLTGVAYRRLSAQEAAARLAALPRPVAALIERMTAERPDDRFPAMDGVVAAIEAIDRYLRDDEWAAATSAEGNGGGVAAAGPPRVIVGSSDAPPDPSTGMGRTPPVNLQPAPSVGYSPPVPAQTAPPRGKRGVLVGVGGLLIVALIAVGALFTLDRGGSTPSATQTAPALTTPLAPAQTNANARLANATNPLDTSTTAPAPNAVNGAGTIAADGTPVGVKIATVGQMARLTFAGTGGQAVAVQASKATFAGCGTTVVILKPDDAPLGSPQAICGGGAFLDPQTLPTSGMFTLLVTPDGATTGQVTLTLYVVVDVTGTIVPDGAPVNVTITTPGQKARYAFTGKGDQIVAVQASKGVFEGCGTTIAILKPDESRLGPAQAICGGGGFLDQLSLPTDGTYTLLVDPDGATTGTATVMMYTVADVTGTIAAGGPPVTVKTTTPGQNARYTFTGTSGQIVAVQASKGVFEGCGTTIAILKPDDSPLGSPQAICGGGGFLDQLSLPTDGTYTLLVDPDGATTGGATLTLYTVVDVTGSITPDGPPTSVKTTTPGQNVRYTFAGTGGEAVTVQATRSTFAGCGTTIAILQPDGSPLGSPQAICGGAGKLDAQRLPASGTYTLLVNPDGATTGETTLALSTVAAQ